MILHNKNENKIDNLGIYLIHKMFMMNAFLQIKGVNLQIIKVAGAQNGNINFRLPSWTVSVYCELFGI